MVKTRSVTIRAARIRITVTSIATIEGKSIPDSTTTIGKPHETGTTSIMPIRRWDSGTATDCLPNTNPGSVKATSSIETCAEGFIQFLQTITAGYLPRHAATVMSSSAGTPV